MPMQRGEWKFKAERLKRFLPTSQRQRGAVDQGLFDIESPASELPIVIAITLDVF
jgi:hypothetical protein